MRGRGLDQPRVSECIIDFKKLVQSRSTKRRDQTNETISFSNFVHHRAPYYMATISESPSPSSYSSLFSCQLTIGNDPLCVIIKSHYVPN